MVLINIILLYFSASEKQFIFRIVLGGFTCKIICSSLMNSAWVGSHGWGSWVSPAASTSAGASLAQPLLSIQTLLRHISPGNLTITPPATNVKRDQNWKVVQVTASVFFSLIKPAATKVLGAFNFNTSEYSVNNFKSSHFHEKVFQKFFIFRFHILVKL